MTMDLISRKSVAKKMLYRRDYVGRPSDPDCIIADEPSIPAVPLDKLCEWLERYATMDCDGCREAFGSCEDEENQEVSVCNSRERWKAMLTKWMEEQDAQKEN